MKIVKTIRKCNNVIFVAKNSLDHKDKKKYRRPRSEKTTEQQREINRRLAEKKLLELIQYNFGGGALHIVLSYSGQQPETPQAALKEVSLFLRRLRYHYKKYGQELKYIQTTERENKRLHHHIIINGIDELPIQIIQDSIWKNGFARATPLESDGFYRDLANYLIKETEKTFNTVERVFGKRYTSSRNLRLPEPVEEITDGDENDLLEIPLNDMFDGDNYILIKESEYTGINPYTGQPYVEYAMIRASPPRKKSLRRRQHQIKKADT